MNTGRESLCRDRGSVDIYQTPMGMTGHQVTTALGAILTIASLGFPEVPNVLFSARNLYIFVLEQSKGVHRAGRP